VLKTPETDAVLQMGVNPEELEARIYHLYDVM